MRAIIVSVDYGDLLDVTLHYNRHHFDEVMVVTTQDDRDTQAVAIAADADLCLTGAFYHDGAAFNKWKALEEGLDCFGRQGLICIMDADVLWPQVIPDFEYEKGCLYTPIRHTKVEINGPVPPEDEWESYPEHPNCGEWAGWTQIFHADDPHLGAAPWHETNWRHAGGADSFFQMKWPVKCKKRPPFRVLHLGEDGVNWCGRATPYIDGRIPSESEDRRRMLDDFRRRRLPGKGRFDHEKIL